MSESLVKMTDDMKWEAMTISGQDKNMMGRIG